MLLGVISRDSLSPARLQPGPTRGIAGHGGSVMFESALANEVESVLQIRGFADASAPAQAGRPRMADHDEVTGHVPPGIAEHELQPPKIHVARDEWHMEH